MVTLSCILLLYTALIVPMQLTFWQNDDPCVVAPTLYLDLFADVYFLAYSPCACLLAQFQAVHYLNHPSL